MTTIEISAHTPASPIVRLAGMRVCAVVIALLGCMTALPLSNRRDKLLRRPFVNGRATKPAGPRGGRAGFFRSRDEFDTKTENTVDFPGRTFILRNSMQRPENAAKKSIFAFVARISLR